MLSMLQIVSLIILKSILESRIPRRVDTCCYRSDLSNTPEPNPRGKRSALTSACLKSRLLIAIRHFDCEQCDEVKERTDFAYSTTFVRE